MVARNFMAAWMDTACIAAALCLSGPVGAAAEDDAPKPAVAATAPGESPADAKVRERLEANFDELSADAQAFEKVMAYLQNKTDLNLNVNWKALEGAGIDKNTPVSVNLRKVTLKKALSTVLSEVGGGTANLAYTIDQGVVVVSTREDLQSAKYQVVRVFDIRDMLLAKMDATPFPSFDTVEGGGDTGARFADNQPGLLTGESREDIVKAIIDTIQSTIAPDTWRDSGGTIGSIRELNGQLIVNQTVDNQTAVAGIIKQLRGVRWLQISLEARLYTVDAETFRTLELPKSGILDDAQLKTLIRTLSDAPSTTLLSAPRMTTFNGQTAALAVTTSQPYTAGYSPVEDHPGVYLPNEAIVKTGLIMRIQPTTSSDTKRVALQLDPTIQTLDGFKEAAAPGVPAEKHMIVQRPVTRRCQFKATVSVPDGHAVVFGGTKPEFTMPGDGGKFTPERFLLVVVRPHVVTGE